MSRTMNGRPRKTIRDMIFGMDQDDSDSDMDEPEPELEAGPQEWVDETRPWDQPSLYVQVTERAISHILEEEQHLLSDDEFRLFKAMGRLDYKPRFILFRIIVRKAGQWFTVEKLQKYTSEVGEQGLLNAFEELCIPFTPGPEPEPMEVDDGIIDLTLDSDDEDAAPVAGPSHGPSTSKPEDSEPRLDYFCESEKDLALLDGLRVLKVDQLKSLCKTLKIPHAKLTKEPMIEALIKYATNQSTLAVVPSPKSKGKGKSKGKSRDTGLRQTVLSFAKPKIQQDQTDRLRELMLKTTGKLMRVNPHLNGLMIRLHIMWFRSTEFPQSLFQPALFAVFKKRVYATYDHVRDPDIWGSREQYLDYERGLQIEAVIDELLKPEPKGGRVAKPSVSAIIERFISPGTPGLGFLRALTTPARTPGDEPAVEFDLDEDTSTQQNAKLVKTIFERHALPKWQEFVSAGSTSAPRKPGLERFESGFIYTRIVRKCAEALQKLKEYAAEKELLDELLLQRLWRRGRRGAWYDRRALVQMNYLCKTSDGTKDMDVLREARQGIIEGLADDDTATVYRPSLIRRLDRVEKQLKMTAAEKAKHDDVILKKPDEVSFTAIRVWDHPDSVKLDASGKVKGKENKTANIPSITNYFVAPEIEASAVPEPKKSTPKWRWTGKSVWEGKDGPVNVETRSLEFYEEQGFKGFHSETQVLTTLFGLLFWDIIFAPVPGAFETPWQTGPLDIADDSFYYARQDSIETRLTELKNGQARSILEKNDVRYRDDKTCCIGVKWDMCGRDDLLEIVECLGGNALSSICRLFCEDYGGRNSGVPDLIVWNPQTRDCRFVEVKGPGDSLSENQKMWSDALLTAGCVVELCHVLDSKAKKKEKPVKKEKATPKPRGRPKNATASTSKAAKGKGRAKTASVKADSDCEEEECPQFIVIEDDDEAWVPSTVIRDPLPPREPKRRRCTVDDDDELPVFMPGPEPLGTPHQPPLISFQRPTDTFTTPSKKRRTM
ncbi:VRR-NUC domain-containing protein [Mycena polygramma]|nr:VRR-NUC domain-containing protein [Mycena polygramma]